MTVAEFLTRLDRVKSHGSYHTARCPGHEDNRESLSISEGQAGKIVLKCHAGCGARDIVQALGLTMSDLFPPKSEGSNPRQEKPAPSSQKTLIAQYAYTDEEGKLLYQALRYQPKEFRQRAPDGKGGWSWSLQGVRRVPYNLPKVIEQASAGRVVYVVEGEKDADALAALGLVATSNAGGAGKWLPDFGKLLAGAHVAILPDNDEPGAKHGRDVASSCLPHAASVRIVALPGLPAKGDVSDWLKKGGTKERLQELAKSAPVVKPEDIREADAAALAVPKAQPVAPPGRSPSELLALDTLEYTEGGNADRMVMLFGEDLRHVHGLGWRVYTGKRWEAGGELAERCARDTVRSLYALSEVLSAMAKKEEDRDQRLSLGVKLSSVSSWARKSDKAGQIAAIVKLARLDPRIQAESSLFDLKPWRVAFPNGVWDRGEFREHRRDDFIESLTAVEYDPRADRSDWCQLLERMTGGDADLGLMLQDIAGYCFSGASSMRILPWLYGPKGTGKSTFQELLQTALGACGKPLDWSLLSGDREGERLGAAVRGTRAVFLPEAGRKRLDADILKTLSGSDRLPGRNLFQNETFTVQPTWALIAVSNDPPNMAVYDDALRDRLAALPFVHPLAAGGPLAFTEGEKMESYRRRTDTPLIRGFVAWAVEGLERVYRAQRIHMAKSAAAHTRKFWEDSDPLTEFWNQLEDRDRRLREGIKAGELRSIYLAWCEAEGVKKPLATIGWGDACRSRGLIKERVTCGHDKGREVWRVADGGLFSSDPEEEGANPGVSEADSKGSEASFRGSERVNELGVFSNPPPVKEENKERIEKRAQLVHSFTREKTGSPEGFSEQELEAWGRYFESIADGRLTFHWPKTAPDGSPYEPVTITPGTTTDDPANWFLLAWPRWCTLWHQVHSGDLVGSRLEKAKTSLVTLTKEMSDVLGQGQPAVPDGSNHRPERGKKP